MLFFLDESGQDHGRCPYEVVGGIGVPEANAWPLISSLHAAQQWHFGALLEQFGVEGKAKQLLKVKKFRHAAQMGALGAAERRDAAFQLLRKGSAARAEGRANSNPSMLELTAYAQSGIEYIREMFRLCRTHGVKTVAVCVHPEAPRVPTAREYSKLEKHLSSLYKLVYYTTDSVSTSDQALLVFDEVENSESRRFIRTTREYFRRTEIGRALSERILPEPFFVHSDLTTLVQVADIVCYALNWGYRTERMDRPVREEMREFGELAASLMWRESQADCEALRALRYTTRGFSYFSDLRPGYMRDAE